MSASASFLLVVALGGALGSVARALVGMAARTTMGSGFPWGTLAVNLAGCAAIALVAASVQGALWRGFLITGVLGGFTTFSAFALDAGLLWDRSPLLAALYVLASVAGGLACFALVRASS